MNDHTQYIGQLFDNRYKIEKIIGSGGMSYVFLAEDTVMNRKVAVKILKDNMVSDEHAVRRFTNESKVVSMLSHPSIVSLYDVSILSETKFIVMEYIDGVTLKQYLDEHGPLDYEETEDIIIQVLSALAHAHSKGIIHRDIKPQNILIRADHTIKVTDFGISKLPGAETVTMSDKAIGTANYINPEQASGKRIDVRSDLYSVGVMLYEMVASRLPFNGDSPLATAYMQIHEKPEPPSKFAPDIPTGLEQIILKSLKKNPENRFQTADEMRSCLERLRASDKVTFDFIFDDDAEKNAFAAGTMPTAVADTVAKGIEQVKNGEVEKGGKASVPEVKSVKKLKPKKEKKTREKPEKVIIKKNGSISILAISLGVLCALMCVVLVAVYYVLDTYIISGVTTSESRKIIIEDYTYMTYSDDFRKSLEKSGFNVSVEWVNSSDYVANTIISQSPLAGETRMIIDGVQNVDMSFVVSMGENMVVLENYSGVDYRVALISIENAGMKVNVVRQSSDSVDEGYVINTHPSAGAVITSDTEITVYVSTGSSAEYITMPDFRGYNSAQLSLALIKYGFLAGKIDYVYSDTYERGTVLSQSILPGQVVLSGPTRLDFVISLGKEQIDIPEEPDEEFEPDSDTEFEG